MSKLPNAPKGEVALPPSAGKNAYLQFSVDAMERFYGELGDDYLSILPTKITNLTPPSFLKVAIETMMVDGDIAKFPFGLPLDELKTLALDAISLALNGRVFSVAAEEAIENEQKQRESRLKKKLEMLEQKHGVGQMAAILADPEIISLMSMSVVAGQGSASATSESTPTTTSSDTTTEPTI